MNNKYFEFIEPIIKNKTNFFIKLLFDNFCYLDLTIEEYFMISYLFFFQDEKLIEGDLELKLSKILNKDEGEILLTISSLIEKKIIIYKEENNYINYSLIPLLKKLFQCWNEKNNVNNKNDFQKDKNQNNSIVKQSNLYCLFEGEFRRLLSPIEIDFLTEWINGKNFSEKMIKEALKEAVLQGKLSFKYIDRILLDWEKKGVFNAKDNEYLKNKKIKKTKKIANKNKKNNYDDLYFN